VTYPLMLNGPRCNALVVGGGTVASRKVQGLLEGGLRVSVVAPEIVDELAVLAAGHSRLTLFKRKYEVADLDGARLVIAATSDGPLNRRIAEDAGERGLLVNVVDDPDAGTFVTPSVHRAGEVIIAVSTGRTPAAAAAIRAELGRRFDGRYDRAIRALRGLRDRLLEHGRRDEWKRASRDLIGDDFCKDVEQGNVEGRVAEWG
jgi:precorrin-2 dehydrogenase / sirohydrochlorin ferrochelatase